MCQMLGLQEGSNGRPEKLKRWSLVEGLQIILRVFLKGFGDEGPFLSPLPPKHELSSFATAHIVTTTCCFPHMKGKVSSDWTETYKTVSPNKTSLCYLVT